MALVELRSVTVERDDTRLVSDLDLVVDNRSLVAVVGASGSGKTSLLRAIAGLERLSTGQILFDGVDVTAQEPARRNIAFAFQEPVLHPSRNVRRNIAFPLEIRRQQVEEIRERVGAEARALHIEELLMKRPSELSAGEAQTVHIARALIRAPALLLLDEPFAHLDPGRTALMRRELLLLHEGFGVTTIVTTNEPHDAMAISDVIVVMERGRIVQSAPPLEVYRQPDTATAAFLTGDATLVEVHVTADSDGGWLVHPAFRIRAWQPALRSHVGRRLQMIVRPEWWTFDPAATIGATIKSIDRTTQTATLTCETGAHTIDVRFGTELARRRELHEGSAVRIRLDHFVLLDPRDGSRVQLD